ncbi:hypothetical protein CEE37_14685 [candidate division LCP-89 bacterium B3_LCP]|uniref:Secretion system C-terminal sorting domain-containing protein n=1 Tax=candidate division LCP-89 bacterium B3_LCP TaxID=2012998 RepID=A0A532UPG8_UNCL8|nr:MAG: hypothetical protein CEE37_14685 [candidate division LCP-89 bacterium B3_LCP]
MFRRKMLGIIAGLSLTAITCFAVMVDGDCFLENQTNHDGTRVLFTADSLGAVTDSAFTDASGYYQIDLTEGSYSIVYTHNGYVDAMLPGQHFSLPATLPDMTLMEPPDGVPISGSLSGILSDTVYVVIGDLSVEAGDSLTIQPGAIFYFTSDSNLNIYGYFSAVGTEMDSIFFLSPTSTLIWGSIIFRVGSSPDNQVSYCRISGAGGSAINVYYTDISISHSSIVDNRANWGGGIYCSNANPTISDCFISGNQSVNNGGGIYCTHCSPHIVDCIITGNACNMYGGGSGRGGGGICANHSSSPIVENCIVTDNYTNENGGGVSINDNSHVQLLECEIYDNTAILSGGGVFCAQLSNVIISDCEITSNDANNGGGLYLETNDSLYVDHCLISDNTATRWGGGIGCFTSDPTITNCTISRNIVPTGGGIYCDNSHPVIVNTIIEGNSSEGGIYFADTLSVEINYCDFYGNTGGSFTGTVPPDLGVLTTVNANGDSCDIFYNIFADPLFVNPTAGDFNLQASSPCIDAGDPASPYDPDGTIADMGAFYFDQTSTSPVTVTLTPFNPPVTVPASGGSFDFNIAVTNNEASPSTFDVWIMVELPNGFWYGPVLGPINLTIPASVSLDRDRTQDIPGNAPTGTYLYEARVGEYPGVVWDDNSFAFEKLADGDGAIISDWINYGEIFDTELDVQIPEKSALVSCYPNPFNPTTVISYKLQDARFVRLQIYDISGRLVAELVNGWRDAGVHEVMFDGSNLASGLYVYRLKISGSETPKGQATPTKATGKIVLMK